MDVIKKVVAALLASSIVTLCRNLCKALKCLTGGNRNPDLSDIFHVYYLTNVCRSEALPKPIWKHGLEQLEVKRRTVKGKRSVRDDPADACDYTIVGEIRHGKMVLVDGCNKDAANFAHILYSDLSYTRRLVGIWLGIGAGMTVTAGAIILSKTMMTEEELNRASSTALGFLTQGTFTDGQGPTDSR